MTEQEKMDFAIEEARGGLLWIGINYGVATVADGDGNNTEALAETVDEIERQIAKRFD